MNPVQIKKCMIIVFLVFSLAFIRFAGSVAGDSLNPTNLTDPSFQPAVLAGKNNEANITIEIADRYTHISNAENISIYTDRLNEKPIELKDPHFKPLLYLEIHADTPINSNTTIRILNEWQRNDLIIYHYKGDKWQPLQTRINGNFLEAVTDSFSIFAVGAPGGINLLIKTDTLILTNDTVTVSGAAYHNNSTAAAGIGIEIKPSWTGFENTTTDQQGNFIKKLTGPVLPGNYTIWVNASSGSLNGTNTTVIQVTNASLYRMNASAVIVNTTVVNPYANISFPFPADAVAEASIITLTLDAPTNLQIRVNNITLYNYTTTSANLNLTGYLTPQNDINITTGSTVNLTYAINLGFHITDIAPVTGSYSAALNVTNHMNYDWNNSTILYHLPEGASKVSVWDNSTNITGSSIISGELLRIVNSGIGKIYNSSTRNFKVNYSLEQLKLNITTEHEEIEKGETVIITPWVYFNGSIVNTIARIIIYRDSVPVYDTNISSGTPFAYSNTIAGVYNITSSASVNIDGMERTGSNRTFIHIKDLLLYMNADPALSWRQIKIIGRAYYTNNTGYEGRIEINTGNESYNTTSNAAGYFSYSIPGRSAGTYTVSSYASAGNSIAHASTSVNVLENYFYLIKGDIPVVSGNVTLAPDATIWINNTNITRASLYLYCKTAIRLIYNPLPIAHKLISTSLNSNISGTFNLPLYPYDFLEILSAFLNTTAEDPVNTIQDMAFNLTIDGREVNSSIIPHGDLYFSQSDNIKGYVPSFLNPGNTQTIKVYNKNTGSTQQYYFTEELYVDYIGHISSPCDLFIKTNNNFTYANIGNFTNGTVDITGFRAASNLVRMNNCRRTSIIGYSLTLQKKYSGYITHSVIKSAGRYNVTDTAVFTPESNLTNVTVITPLIERARDVLVFTNGTNVSDSASIGENMELFLSEVNSTRVINITYWTPIFGIAPSVNNTQFNRGDTVQIKADVTYLGANVSDATVYANVTKAGVPVANVTLNNAYGGTYLADYVLSPSAALGIYNVTVWAYNATTALDSENISFRVGGLNVTVNAGGPYPVDSNATITGYVRDLENSSGISGALVNITIWNSTFSYITAKATNSTGYYNLSRPVDAAGDYNVTVNASDVGIIGSAYTTYRVKYNVNVPLQSSYNRNSSVSVNITVYDRSLVPVEGAAVNSTIMIGGAYSYYNGTTDGNGMYNFTFGNTSSIGYYNLTVNVSKAGVIGNATGSFRVSSLSITEYTEKTEYNAGENVTIQGAIKDIEVNDYIASGIYNISIYSPSGFVASRQGNISNRVNTSGKSLWDEDTFETSTEWSGRNYYTPVRDSTTAFTGLYSLRMTWPGTTGWGGRNFEGAIGLEGNQTSAGYSTDTYPYMSMAYRIGSGDIINMLILVNGVWRSVALTQGSDTGGSYPTVATWGNLITDDKWHWTQINLDEQLDASMGTGNHQITAVIWYPNPNIATPLTGEFWIDDFRISDKPLSVVSYNETFGGYPAGQYTAYVNVTYGTMIGYNSTSFDINYNVNASISRMIYSISEVVPINITVFDTNNTPANAEVSINITKPDASVENLNGTAVNGYFNASFTNATLEGDYIIAVHAQNSSKQAHGDAINRNFRASGFTVNVSLDRSPALYKPGETVNFSGALKDTLGAARVADVLIRINSSSGIEAANTTLYSMNGSYSWKQTLSADSVAGWYTVTVSAITPEGVVNGTATRFEVQLNLDINAGVQYNPNDEVNITVLVRNGTAPESAAVNVTVQKFDIWTDFAGTYFNTTKMILTTPDVNTGYYLNFNQSDELVFYTPNLTPGNTWVGKAIRLNTTILPSQFILDYETSTGGTSDYLLTRPIIGNSTNYVVLNFVNYSDDSQDGYDVFMNSSGTWMGLYSKRENTNNQKVRFSIEYSMGTLRFYKNHEQFYQLNYTLPPNSFIKLNGYARHPTSGTNAYTRFDNVTLYDLSSPVLNQGTASGSSGNYTFNFTAGPAGMYRINAATGNSSAYTAFLVRTLNVTSILYGPYNFNESTLSNNTIVPLIVHGTVQDTETHAGISGAEVNVAILQNGSIYAYRTGSSNSGNYSIDFTGDFNSIAAGLFNVSVSVNDSGILAINNNSFTAYTINQSWVDPYRDYRVPILLYNGNLYGNQGITTFNLALPGGYAAGSVALYDIKGNIQPANIIDFGSYINVTFSTALEVYEGKVLYLYFERPSPSVPQSAAMSSLSAPYSVINGTVEGYAVTVTPDKSAYSAGENVVLASQVQNITGDYTVTDVTTRVYYPNGTLAQVNYTRTNATGVAQVNYTIPPLKGSFTAVASATVDGLMRMEGTNFNVGDLTVIVGSDKAVYNTLEKANIGVNVSENGTTAAADVVLKIYDSNNVKVFEETKNTTGSLIYTINSQGSDSWQYAGAGIPLPGSGNWVIAASNEKSAISSNDSNRWETRLTTGHGQFDYQMYRFQVTQPVNKITNLTARWIGYGETITGYDTYLYIWNNSNNSWYQLDAKHLGIDGTLNGSITSNIGDYVDNNGSIYIAAAAKHYNYAPQAPPSGLSAFAGYNDVTISWSPVTDPENDTVQYYAEIDGVANSGWINGTSWYYSGLSQNSYYTYRVKARDTYAPEMETLNSTSSFWTGSSKTSCPFVYIWNGTGYEYITDLQGAPIGAPYINQVGRDHAYYDLDFNKGLRLQAQNGVYNIHIRESIMEADFFDYAKLVIADVPEGYEVLTDWHGSGYGPGWHIDGITGKRYNYSSHPSLFSVKNPRTAISVIDSKGANVTDRFAEVDEYPAPETRSEFNYYTLDFGNIEHPEYAKLILYGWMDYHLRTVSPQQGLGVQQQVMSLEVVNRTGDWQPVAELGIFMGDLKPAVYNISNIWITNDHRIRIHSAYTRTSTGIIDKVEFDDSPPADIEVATLNLTSANFYHGGRDALTYSNLTNRNHASNSVLPDLLKGYFYGNFTKYGDVTPLLDKIDNKYVIIRHGDELDLVFQELAKKPGKNRRAFLDAFVWYSMRKTADGEDIFLRDVVNPLPFYGMTRYPYNSSIENYPYDEEHIQYLNEWNTRVCEDRINGTCYDAVTGENISEQRIIEQHPVQNGTVPHSLNTNYVEVTAGIVAPVNFTYTLPSSPLGKYTVTASASKSGNAGYNTTIFELDRFDINTTADKPVYSSSENITVSGSTNYRGGNANANVNISVKKNFAFNPSFETDLDNNGRPDGWIPAGSPWNGTGTRDTVSRTGSYSVKVWRSSTDIAEGLWYYPNMYVISAGTHYTFSTWVKTDSIASGDVRLWVTWYNGTAPLATAINAQQSINAQNGWVLVQGSATSPGNADNVRVHLVSNVVGNVWFDDVNIEPEGNPDVYTASTISNTYYSFIFSLNDASSYILYTSGSYAANGTLNRSSTTIFTVRNLTVNTSAGGPFEPGNGSVMIAGYVADSRTRMAVPGAFVNMNITYPNGTLKTYTNTTDTAGYYIYTIGTPQLGGTYLVNITAKDYQNVMGNTNTTFRVGLTLSVRTDRAQYNANETAQITVNVNDSTLGIGNATVNITVRNPAGATKNFSTLYGNVTYQGSGVYRANYSDTAMAGNYTVNVSASNNTDSGGASTAFKVRKLNVTIQNIIAKVGDPASILGRVEDETTHATAVNASMNITIANSTSIISQTNITSGAQSGYNIVSAAYTERAGRYNITINATDQNNIKGNAVLPYTVNLSINITLDQVSYNPKENITAAITIRESTASMASGATVVTNLTYYNGTVISSNTTAADADGKAVVSFNAPGDYSSYLINVTASKNGIDGTASSLFTSSNLRIWTDKGEALIGSPAWASNGAPEKYRNITIKVALLDSSGMRRTGQSLTAYVYKPDGTVFGTYILNESDKIYSTSILLPGNNIPEGNYTIKIAEYPGVQKNFSVIIWGCARCHGPNAGVYIDMGPSHNPTPSSFNINHSHQDLGNSCDNCHGMDSSCTACHSDTIEGKPWTTSGPTQCKTCHFSPDTNQGYLNNTYGADLHANINTKLGGPWYGKETACQSCHGDLNSTEKPKIPQCTDCHPNSSGSGMQTMPGKLGGYNTTLEDFEDVSDIIVTSGYRYSTIAISTDTDNHSGTYSGKVDYSFGPGYGRVYLDKKNLDLTNATKISLWVYGDNSNTTLYVSLNNTKSTKVSWHQSPPIQINWTGWRKISVSIHELSQHDLMYISFADTVRIKLESNSETGYSSTILIDDLKKEAVGSHTQYDEVECGLCHGGRHDIKRAPHCQDCHQTQEHGWPAEDKYPGNNATCMNCHRTDVTENRINISNISEHTELLEDFENNSLFTASLTYFTRSDIYYSGAQRDDGNHSARLNYTGLTGYLGNSINATNAYKFKGISVFVNASYDPGTKLVLGVYTSRWNNYTISMDWNGWRQFNILYHNITVNESTSFNATGTPGRIWLGVYGTNSTGTVYFDDLRQAVSDDYHQYESWRCADCHIQIKNQPGITDITSPITNCSLCHNLNEPHYKQFTRVCMDCHFDSRHGEVDDGNFTNYEKASTCLKCHTVPHDYNRTHLETADCNQCHQQRIHGQNYQNVQYNRSKHLDCERCHGKTTAEAPLPMGLGSPRTTILRLSFTYNNETQCLYCHKDRIVAYELHINSTVDKTNQTLVNNIQNDTFCNTCHGTKSILNDSDRDELTAIDPKREPYAPQIEGHGNVSCYKCHGHRPETLTLNYGSNCVGCHQNKAELIELMPGMVNHSRLTNVTNPGEKQLIVHPPQVTGHGNASCSNCHGHVNSNLTYIGSTASDCAGCHENASSIDSLLPYRQPNSSRSTITDPGGNPLYVIPPQVLGHGNTSCKECHEHAPSTFNGFNFIEGMVCENCHQNNTRNVSMIENTTPNSNKTKLIDNTTGISPQVAGHGLTACSVCHSHSAERMVYYGGNNTDCIFCHFNESSKDTLLRNGSYVKSTQITPHEDMNCTECHGHTPSNMTRINDCRLCHQNTTKAQSLIEIYGTGLNITSPAGNISAVQIPLLNHSNSAIAGRKWNKTTAYWVNGSDSCQYCHAISRNYSGHNPLGRVSAIAGNNTRNSSLSGSYWCAACHFQGYSSGNITYNDMVRMYLEAGLPVPPEITANISYGNYVNSNDGVNYYKHVFSDYSDAACAACHGQATNTREFLHSLTEGGGGTCMGCHNEPKGPLDNPAKYPAIVNISFGKHNNVNTIDGNNSLTDNDCKTCHYNFSFSQMNLPGFTTPTRKCEDCHTEGNFLAPVIKNHRPAGVNISTAVYCSNCHNNSINKYYYSENASVSHYGTNASLIKPTVNQMPMPRFGFMTQADASSYNQECNNCHNPSNPKYGNATLITVAHVSRGTCTECHVNATASDLHNGSLGMPQTFSCIGCHTTFASKYRAPNLTGTSMTSFTNCEGCHGGGNGNQLLDTLFEHNINRYQNGYTPAGPGSTDTVYLNGQTSLSVTTGAVVTVTSRVNDTPGLASRVGGAEYYIDNDPGVGKGTLMEPMDGQYNAANGNWENITGTIDTNTLSEGTHIIYVRGMDIGKQWSVKRNATLIIQSLGYINGTVTSSGSLVAGAVVSTTGANDTTKSDGTYSLSVPEGTYIVTVSKRPMYNDSTVTGIGVTLSNTTIVNFSLVQKPTGTISGVVTNV